MCDVVSDLWHPEGSLQGPRWRGGSSAASGGAGGSEEFSVPVHVQTLLQSPPTLSGGLPQEPGEEDDDDGDNDCPQTSIS